MTDSRVLTLQDISCVGQCSLTVALPIISACGVETVILPSAVLSTHTAFKGFTFRDLTEDIPGIMEHWQRADIRFDCLYTGYLGSVTQIGFVEELKKNLVKEGGLLIVDPAMADNGKLYTGFDEVFVQHMAKLCGTADIILPNMTEAVLMTGSEMRLENQDETYVVELLNKLSAFGCKTIVLKGIQFDDDRIGVAVHNCANHTTSYIFTERIRPSFHGTGDCFAAAFTGAVMQGKDVVSAVKLAAAFVGESIRKTVGDETHQYGVKFEKALPMLVSELNR